MGERVSLPDDDSHRGDSPAPERRAKPIGFAERVGPFEVTESFASVDSVEAHETGRAPSVPSPHVTTPVGDQGIPPRRPRLFGIGERLWTMTGGMDPTPLVVLFLLYFFDEFDTGAFNTLAPNIKASFGLTDQTFGLVVVLNLVIVLLFAVPVGHLGDRVKRVSLVVIGALVAGSFSFLTGIVASVGLLLVVRAA